MFPVVSFTIEWCLNSHLFVAPRTFWYSLYITLAYIPLSYFGKDFLGVYPYSFIDWTDYKSPLWIGLVFLFQTGFYWATAITTNLVKSRFTVANPLATNMVAV